MTEIRTAADWLKARDGYLILTHKRPDGDTLGCAVALCLGLRDLGKTAFLLKNPEATAQFDPYLTPELMAPDGFIPDTVVSVDIASETLFPENAACWKGKVDFAIDHHPSNEYFAKETLVESDKAACGEILYSILVRMTSITPKIAEALYVAITTDTGCFIYSNTSPNTHRVAAALMETRFDAPAVNKRHFRTKSLTRMRVEAHLLATMDLRDEGRTAIVALSLDDMDRFHATENDVDDISAFIGQVEGVENAITIRELKGGKCKLSVRTGEVEQLNATQVCALLGGGGHARAAGCTVSGSIDQAKEAVWNAIQTVRSEAR